MLYITNMLIIDHINQVSILKQMDSLFSSFGINPYQSSFSFFPSFCIDQSQSKQLLKSFFECSNQKGTAEVITAVLSSEQIKIIDKNNRQQIVELCFQLKFQILYCDKNNIRSSLHGFRLKNSQINFQMILTSKNLGELTLWVDQLTRKINRLGFKEYFKPIQRLGKGGYGTVYQVQSLLDKKRYAAKAYPKNFFKQKNKALKSLINQINILRKLNHKNTLKLQGVYESQNTIYILLEILKGGNLFQRMFIKDGRLVLSESQIKQIIKGTLSGLSYLESLGIVHRDIKPQNIMLRNMSSFEPVIIDFGFSMLKTELKDQIQGQHTDIQVVYPNCGTPGFMAPQLFSPSPINIKYQYITGKTDIFALGVTFYILCAKSSLFQGKDPRQVILNNKKMQYTMDQNINKQIRDLIQKMIASDMNQRIDAKKALNHSYFKQITSYQSYQQYAINNSNIKMLLQRTSDKCDQDKKVEQAQI